MRRAGKRYQSPTKASRVEPVHRERRVAKPSPTKASRVEPVQRVRRVVKPSPIKVFHVKPEKSSD